MKRRWRAMAGALLLSVAACGGSGTNNSATANGAAGGNAAASAGAATGTEWGVWASAAGGQWSDPCAIQYAAAQVAGNRYDGNPGYRRVRTRATQPEADLDIDHFGRYHRDQPDGVVKMTSCSGGGNGAAGGAGNSSAGTSGGAGTPGGGGDPLGTEWSETESGWSGRWTRRAGTNTFDAVWSNGGSEVRATLTITIAGDRVTVNRVNASDSNNCQYDGTLSGSSVSGTYRCTSGGGEWSATIR